MFVCPVCRAALFREGNCYRCENGHNFDVARQGYVNLLRAQGGAKFHGDDKGMVLARQNFLSAGHYACLQSAVRECAAALFPSEGALLDAGCGEGYYTEGVLSTLRAEKKTCAAYGVDISKEALIAFSRRTGEVSLAVASVAELPFEQDSFDLILNLFAPQSEAEFFRVLKPHGHLLCVFPLEDHLMGLKRLLYETPYLNPTPDYRPEGFALKTAREVRKSMTLTSSEEIFALFQMTPYYYKTSPTVREALHAHDRLETPISFGIYIYEKN